MGLVSVMEGSCQVAKKVCALGIISDRTSSGHLSKEGKGFQCGCRWCIHTSSCDIWECSIISLARSALLLKHFYKTDHGFSHYC